MNNYPPQKRAWAWHYYASEYEKSKLYNIKPFYNIKSSLRFFYDFKNENDWTPEDFIRQDRLFYFPNEMLQKVDRMTMACSVEGRSPFAAPSILAHAEKLKYYHLVKKKSLKWVLRKAFSDILPTEVYTRSKHGFNVPIDHWLKNDWFDLFEETFSPSSYLMKFGIINKKSRDVAFSMLHDKTKVNGHTIFSFIILNLWLENYANRNYS